MTRQPRKRKRTNTQGASSKPPRSTGTSTRGTERPGCKASTTGHTSQAQANTSEALNSGATACRLKSKVASAAAAWKTAVAPSRRWVRMDGEVTVWMEGRTEKSSATARTTEDMDNENDTRTPDQPPFAAAPLLGGGAERWTIKPLCWERKLLDWWQSYRADVPMGGYYVERMRLDNDPTHPWKPWRWGYHFGDRDEDQRECASLTAGKAAAEADWRERLLPALVKSPNSDSATGR